MAFAKPDSLLAQIICVIGVLVIIAAVIATTHIRLHTISLYEWVIYLVLIFGGAGLLQGFSSVTQIRRRRKREKRKINRT